MAKEGKCVLANMVCPRNGDPEQGKYCPKWLEYMETNQQTGEQRLRRECSERVLPQLMGDLAKACDGSAAAVESTRNEIAGGFSHIRERLQLIPTKQLEDKS